MNGLQRGSGQGLVRGAGLGEPVVIGQPGGGSVRHLPERSGVINSWNMGAEQDPGFWGCSFIRKLEGAGVL